MKKHFKFISKSILLSVVSSTMISSGLILSSCVNKKDDNDNNDSSIETPNGEIKIEDQSPTTNEVSSDSTLTLYVNVTSNKPVKYQWYVDKNNNTWIAIDGATESSYNITKDSIESVTKDTTWKYKAEIYDANDSNIKLTSKIYSVNIKPQQTTPNPSPEPSPDPIPPTNPEPNPPSPNPPTSPSDKPTTSIESTSIKLKNIGQLLPSQYLNDLNNEVINVSLIEKRFDTNKITKVSYKLTELNDRLGTLSILMNYTEDSINKSYKFSFTNLLKLEDSGYNLEFVNATGILNLSAQTMSEKTLDSKSKFEEFINELSNSNIKFKFKIKGIELPLRYLSFSKVNITGFSADWFTTNKKVALVFSFQNLKINYYEKTINSGITSNNFDYPTNTKKDATMEFYSASDYLLNQITNNNSFQTNEYAAYYYYDIVYNDALYAQVKISDSNWLSNVTTQLTYNNKNYIFKPILNKSTISSENGSLTINLSMEYQDNGSMNVRSQTTKNIIVTGFSEYDQNNLFSNSNENKNRFSLWCNVENYENNIKKLKIKRDLITKKIEINENLETNIIFTSEEIPETIIKNLISSVNCKFSNEILVRNDKNKDYYYNGLTAIEGFNIEPSDTLLRYDKSNDVFQLIISNFSITGVGVNSENYAINDNEMIVNITSLGNSLQKLKDLA